jgi:hypothetical protein
MGKVVAEMADENETEGTENENEGAENENDKAGTENAEGDKGGESNRDGETDSVDPKEFKRIQQALKAANQEAAKFRNRVKEFEDKDKSESQRLTEAAQEAQSRAEKAESAQRKLQTAIDRAPEGATFTQIKAVAKRIAGDSEDELASDADELFALMAPAKTKAPNGKPRETLRGGGDPDDPPEEMDPRKLADLIGRP